MFSGIVEEVGRIKSLRKSQSGGLIVVSAKRSLSDLKPGDSIAVNGVCLTVTSRDARTFSADLSAETLKRTTFSYLQVGDPVNLERPLVVGGRVGGHFVQGHVDGIGFVKQRSQQGQAAIFQISYPSELDPYLVYKGSIAVNGVSLTIASLARGSFQVAIIPHTLENTTFKYLKVADPVNLECDMIGKYVARALGAISAPDDSPAREEVAAREAAE